jgi:3-deoxy-D-manno-octulosonate 8-phosphate phosphatase (KDO 8-P phosphatase)
VNPNSNVRNRASKIKLLLMDVDGVLTNGKLFHFPDAQGNMVETKGFDSQDGIALQWMQWKGLKTGVISGRESLGTAERARQVKMNYVYQGHIEKIPIFEKILAEANVQPEEVAYMGDDLTDLVVMRRVGFAVAVANARPEVKRGAHYVTEASGGNGAVREVIEIILEAQGFWPEILDKYST